MSKRYVFWRQNDARPFRGTGDRYAPVALLSRLGESASITSEGTIQWPFPNYHTNQLAVSSMAVILDPDGNELNETDTASIFVEAIKREVKSIGAGKALSSSELLSRADTVAAERFRKPKRPFVAISTLSVKEFPKKSIQLNGSKISPLKKRTSRYPVPESVELRAHTEPFGRHIRESNYLTVRTCVTARTATDAADKAIDSLNLLRGLWTIPATCGSWTIRLGASKMDPIGVIHNGPIHTVHKPDGAPVGDVFWFEPGYVEDRPLFVPKSGWDALDSQRLWAVRKLQKLPYRAELERFIVRFVVALDQVNPDLAFLQMWSLLEAITDTIGANYDKTIDRSTWAYADRRLNKELLGHLRLRRNRLVHAAKSGERSDEVAYTVKAFVEPHLVNLLRNDFKVTTIREYAEYLSFPSTIDELRKRRDALDRAIYLRDKR